MSTEYVLASPGEISSRQRSFGDVPDGWARVRFHYCGLCGSDISHFEGRPGVTYPIAVGHEFVGEVVETGAGVEAISPGDVVTSDLNYRCEECDYCRAGRSHLCRVGQQGLFTNRGFADFGDLDVSYLVPLKARPSPHLTLVEPLSCVLHARDWAGPSAEDRILVIGAGSIGLCMVIALRNHPTQPSFEVTDEMPPRLERLAAVCGSRGEAVSEPEGEFDVVFDVSGTEAGLERACRHVRGGGRLCSMSHPNGNPVSPFLVGAILRKDVTFTVSYLNGERVTMLEAARLLEHHWEPSWNELIELIPIANLQEAYEGRRQSPYCKTVIAVHGD
ncbi:MAG TPA: alcohol dehydrogenase catalytic domain-containing protein [Solirubrobacterales bacterium]|nr:alcohol dehydrogenase catalytic domain-containing protein [Solirubrobacterales bacterium]